MIDTDAIKTIYFDMDDTIAMLSEVPNWLERLRSYDPTPYSDARPIPNIKELGDVVQELKSRGYRIGIVSWLSMESNTKYDAQVRKAKCGWLKKWFPYADEVHIVKYGTPKHQVVRNARNGILVDDNADNRATWRKHGLTAIDANNSHAMVSALEMCTTAIVD